VDPYAWPFDPDTLLLVPLSLAAYFVVLRRFPATRWRIACFVSSQLLIFAVFDTPVETIALGFLLCVHLLQNVVVAEWAPALAILGLPGGLAAQAERIPLVRRLTHPLVALPLWLGNYYIWHIPYVYDLALHHQQSILHLEHGLYFWTGSLMWWPVFHGRLSSGLRAGYVFAAFVLAAPLGLLMALVEQPAYDWYVEAPRLWGLSPIADQQLAGVTMASEQAVVLFAAFAFWFLRFMREEG
jgi:putative membrane protein